jgi:hypothetical protein
MTHPDPPADPLWFPLRGTTPGSVPAPPRDPEPLPAPTGTSPYRLSLVSVLPASEYAEIQAGDHLTFRGIAESGLALTCGDAC